MCGVLCAMWAVALRRAFFQRRDSISTRCDRRLPAYLLLMLAEHSHGSVSLELFRRAGVSRRNRKTGSHENKAEKPNKQQTQEIDTQQRERATDTTPTRTTYWASKRNNGSNGLCVCTARKGPDNVNNSYRYTPRIAFGCVVQRVIGGSYHVITMGARTAICY